MRIPTLVWFFIFVTFMTVMRYLQDYFDYETSLLLFVSFGCIYIFTYGIYKMGKMLKYDTNLYDLVFTLLLLFMGIISGKVFVPAYTKNNSTSTKVCSIILAIVGFLAGIIKYYKLVVKNNQDQNQDQDQPTREELQPLV